ncbi:MAG: hypothetical protein WC449_05150 [Candidatus Paceibacterota bacterium]
MNNNFKQEILVCSCNGLEHIIRFSNYFECGDPEEVVVDFHLAKKPFLQRVVYAVKYVFGYQSKYGAFDEILLDVESVSRLQEFLTEFQKEKKDECQKGYQ